MKLKQEYEKKEGNGERPCMHEVSTHVQIKCPNSPKHHKSMAVFAIKGASFLVFLFTLLSVHSCNGRKLSKDVVILCSAESKIQASVGRGWGVRRFIKTGDMAKTRGCS
jgi:hypothetical protein